MGWIDKIMRISQVVFAMLSTVILSCTPTPEFIPVELEIRNFLNEPIRKQTVYLSTSETNGVVDHLYYYDYPDTTNKYHFKVTLDSSNRLTYFGEILNVNRVDTIILGGTRNTIFTYNYNLENTFDEETDVYVNMGRIIFTHNISSGTKNIFNYDSASMSLNNKIATKLQSLRHL